MNKKLKTEAVDHLFQAILTLKSTTAFLRMSAQSMSCCLSRNAMKWPRCSEKRGLIWKLPIRPGHLQQQSAV